jgi:cytochrome c oxidase subunit 3
MNQTVSLPLEDRQQHRDASKFGMRLLIIAESVLFLSLFMVYVVYRYLNPVAFRLAAEELSVGIGILNTIAILVSSMTLIMATTAIRKGKKTRSLVLLITTLLLAVMFMINRYFEWKGQVGQGLFPGSETLFSLGNGEVLFYNLYFLITGLYALHLLLGIVLFSIVLVQVEKGQVTATNSTVLNSSGFMWHLFGILWLVLFTLFYILT